MKKIKRRISRGINDTVSTFDKEGRLISEELTFKPMPSFTFNADMEPVYLGESPIPEKTLFKYIYNSEGKLISKTRTTESDPEHDVIKYEYDENGYCISEEHLLDETKIIKEYNEKGLLSKITGIPGDTVVNFNYNEKGELIETESIFEYYSERRIFEYDENGRTVKNINNSSETVFEYNDNGDMIHSKTIITDEEKRKFLSDIETFMKYDDEGYLVEEITDSGKITYEYEFYEDEE